MKKEYLKRFGLVTTIAIGMLLTNITPTFALTNENFEETTLVVEETPITETDSTMGDIPSDTNDSTVEEIPVDKSNPTTESTSTDEDTLNTEDVPSDENNSNTEEIPSDENDSNTEEVPSDENDLNNEEVPSGENDSNTEGIPSNENDSNTEEIPSDENDSNTEEIPSDENDSNTEEIPSDENDSNVEETPADKTDSNEKDKKTNVDEIFNNTENPSTENTQNPTFSDTDSDNILSETPQPDSLSAKSDVNLSYEETKTGTSKDTSITDNNTQALYIQPAHIPSELFIDIEDRVKYNTRLPIDNIPSFITQEMIVGALKCQDEMNYPASVTIAQIILESGFGQYGPGGEDRQGLSYLAYEYCNLFGIKGVGTAGSVDMRTGEQTSSGEYYTINAGFRVYNTYTECIQDRTDLLKNVYSDLITKATDANTFATRIGSRWATSLQYSQNLISIMKRYDLYRLDRMTLKDFNSMTGKFADPCPGAFLTSEFGYRTFDNSFHKGIDLGTNGSKIPTYAADAGTVIVAGYNASAGNWIVIDHGDGLVTKYMHHSHIFVSVGDKVEKGQQIGLTGNTGNSFGIHLHFQVEENGVAVDPSNYFDFDLK